MISNDEDAHLAYCHEELLRLAARGHGPAIRRALRRTAVAENVVHREVSLSVMSHMGRLLDWPAVKTVPIAAGIHVMSACERFGGWRRMVRLTMPEQLDALGRPARSTAPVV
jgi:hypothetical protein